jgi:hypothetical protein
VLRHDNIPFIVRDGRLELPVGHSSLQLAATGARCHAAAVTSGRPIEPIRKDAMDPISRRNMLAAAAASGLLTAATTASAQTSGAVPQPQRPGRGGTDPGPRNLMRDAQNPDLLVPPSTDHGTLPNLRFSFSDAHVRLERAAGPAR